MRREKECSRALSTAFLSVQLYSSVGVSICFERLRNELVGFCVADCCRVWSVFNFSPCYLPTICVVRPYGSSFNLARILFRTYCTPSCFLWPCCHPSIWQLDLLKGDRFLGDADWEMVWRYIPVSTSKMYWHRIRYIWDDAPFPD